MDTNFSPTSVRLPHRRTDVFISYSHKDKWWLDQLRTMLSPIVRMGAITIWDDTQIRSGTKWYDEIKKALDTARVAVLLVSPNFLASDFITEHELPELQKAEEQEGLIILPILVRQCLVKDTPLEKYQSTNNLARPLKSLTSAKRDEALVKICEEIKQAAAFDKAFEFTPQKATILKWPDPSVPLGPANSKPIQSVSPKELVEELVDFEKEQGSFRGMLDRSSEKRLMFVRAPGMCGKTSLLHMLHFHCKKNSTPTCWIDFRMQPYDNPHFTLAHAMCDQFGLAPRNLAQIMEGASLTHDDLHQPNIKERLNRAFLADLGDFALKKGGIVCLFDGFEDIRAEEENWLINTLLTPVKKGDLKGVIIVTSGHCWPKVIEKSVEWEECAHLIDGLPRMSLVNLKIYAQKVGVPLTDKQAEDCWNASNHGNPLIMSMVVKMRVMAEVEP